MSSVGTYVIILNRSYKKIKSSLSNQVITSTCGDTYLLSTSAIRRTAAPVYGKHDTFETGCGTFPTSFCRCGDGWQTNTATQLGHGLVLELCGRRMCRGGVHRDFIRNVEVCGFSSSTKQNRVARTARSQNVAAAGQWNRNIRHIQRHRITDKRGVFRTYQDHGSRREKKVSKIWKTVYPTDIRLENILHVCLNPMNIKSVYSKMRFVVLLVRIFPGKFYTEDTNNRLRKDAF